MDSISLWMLSVVAVMLFSIGAYGVVAKRDIIRLLISVSIMLASITLLLVTLCAAQPQAAQYQQQSLVLFVWGIEVAEILVAFAIFIFLARQKKTDMQELMEMKW